MQALIWSSIIVFAPSTRRATSLCVAFRVPGHVEDILDDLPAVVEPEPELLVIERERDVLAGLFWVLVADEREEEGPFGRFAPVADTGNQPGGGG